MNKFRANLFYQLLFQTINLLLPILTIPLISRALGPEGLGMFNYVNSYTNYYLLFIGFGLSQYGVKEISKIQNNKQQLSETFWELSILNFISGVVVIVIYLLIMLTTVEDPIYQLMQVFVLFGGMFDISWFFMGIENFKKVSLANLFVKLLSFILVITLVNDKEDLCLFFMIQSVSLLISQTILWFFLKHYVSLVPVKMIRIGTHLKNTVKYFTGKISIAIFSNINKTALGFFTSNSIVGYYANTDSIVWNITILLTVLDSVMLPRMSRLAFERKHKDLLENLKRSIEMQAIFTIPSMFGIIAISPKLVEWFFGSNFSILTMTLPALSPLIVLLPLNNTLSRQYIIPMDKQRDYNTTTFIGIFICVILNIVLIPLIGIWGAFFSYILSQLYMVSVHLITLYREQPSFKIDYLKITKILLSSIFMAVIVFCIGFQFRSHWTITFFQLFLGIFSYAVSLWFLKVDEFKRYVKEREA